MDETLEITTAPPDITSIIQDAIRGMGLATSDEVQAIAGRVERVEQTLAELPTTYALREEVRRVVASQEDYEMSRRLLTKQVADLANVQVDSQAKYATIESRLNDLSTMKGMLTTFMETQRERLDHQQLTITEAKITTAALAREVAFVKTTQADAEQRYNSGFKPVHDFIAGSETQKPLMTIIDGMQTAQTTQGQTLQAVADYVKAQQQKEADRRSFWRSVRLQMWTWRGILSALLAVLVFLIIANSINFDQLFERIRQLADALSVLFNSGKVS